MLLSSTLAHFNAKKHAFLFSEEVYINFDKNGPLEHIHSSSLVTQTLAQSILYVNLI